MKMHYVSMWNRFSIYVVTYITTFNILNQLNTLMVYLGPWFSPIFQVNDPKIHIYLDDFSSFLELMMQKPQIEFSQLITSFYMNEKIDSTLMKILNSNWDSQLQYVVSLFNTSYNTNITKE